MKKPPLIILTGPTAVGKTSLSIRLAKAIDGEIISADSMQVYRHMDIGSAKVTPDEMQGVPHHLIDAYEPEEEFNVVEFQRAASAAAEDIEKRGKIPVVCGGTGFYIQALLRRIDFTETGGDPDFRKNLEERAARGEGEALYRALSEKDPASAAAIHPNNLKRVIRALEYYYYTGECISLHNEREKERKSPYNYLYLVLNRDRQELYRRIDLRVDAMMEQGLLEEVRYLYDRGCRRGMVSMQGLGYKELLDYLEGQCTLEEAVEKIKRDTRHFAKRQLTWFRREPDTVWLNWEPGITEDAMLGKILALCRDKKIGKEEQ